MLLGRIGELEILDQLIARARDGQSAVLVLRGEAGIGKTALLQHLMSQAPGFRVARATGVESEMELAFAGLHQLCAPLRAKFFSTDIAKVSWRPPTLSKYTSMPSPAAWPS
jgi:hypothetical protein